MPDKIKPLKIENLNDGSQDDQGYPTESNPAEDYVATKGIAFENSDNHVIYLTSGEITFKDPVNGIKLLSDLAASSSGITESQHRSLDQLVHNIAESNYYEITRTNNKITNVCYYTNSGKTEKIREENVTYTNNKVSQVITKQFDNGILVETYTETYTYTNNKVSSITGVLS